MKSSFIKGNRGKIISAVLINQDLAISKRNPYYKRDKKNRLGQEAGNEIYQREVQGKRARGGDECRTAN